MTARYESPRAVPKPDRPDTLDEVAKATYEKSDYDAGLILWSEAQKQQWSEAATATALDATRDDALVAAETASLAAIQAAYIATTQSTLDRVLTRMNVLTASIGTIVTLYTGLLAFIYTKAETATGGQTGVNMRPLQSVALVPVVFLATALFLATVYASVLRKKTTVGPFLPTGIGGQIAEMRLVTYMNWCFAGVLARRWALHAGVVSLGVGIATLPLPFIKTSGLFKILVFAVGLVVILVTALISAGYWKDAGWLKKIRGLAPMD